MILFALVAVLALAAFGCVCVVWAARGGPRWVRVVATATLLGGELARAGRRRGLRGDDDTSGRDGGGSGSDG
ncbi:hypothetical protein [Streptomyces sp. NPDC093089]|uniref:hypothetical protein n=1 Tax=Streptomyces sp. NPDC093089 TaxID=3366024 RepID=UPI0037F7B783